MLCVDVKNWDAKEDEFADFLNLIHDVEQARVKRFRFEDDRKRALVGRLLIRKIVVDALGVENIAIRLERTKQGKPYLVQVDTPPTFPRFNFNISHHGNWVVGAYDFSSLVGVDVMKFDKPRGERSISDFFSTMSNCFTQREWDVIKGEGDEETKQLIRFYEFWCLKESYIKAVGIGLGMELTRMEFSSVLPHPDGYSTAILFVDGNVQNDWKFRLYRLDDDHCTAIANGPVSQAVPEFLSSFPKSSNNVEAKVESANKGSKK